MRDTLKSRGGFTLVEIMIVVAIIGIIIAIAVPAFLRARENARGQACQENLTKIDGAKEQYALEYRLSNGSNIPGDIQGLIQPNGASVGSGYLKATPNCASGGSYMLSPVGSSPQCSIGYGAGFAPHVLPGADGISGPSVGGPPGGPPGGGP